MRPLEILIIAVALLMVTTCGKSPAPEALAGWDGPFYAITLTSDAPGLIRVSAHLPNAPAALHMSENGANNLPDGWATFVSNLVMTDVQGTAITVKKSGPRSWQMTDPPAGSIDLSYTVTLAHDTVSWSGGIDGAALQLPWGAFFAGRAVFVLPDSLEGPIRVALRTSPDWDVAAPWPEVHGRDGEFEAPTANTLTESYGFIGEFDGFTIERGGFELVFALGGPSVIARAEEFQSSAEAVFDYYIEMMGGPPRPAPGEPSDRVLVVINEGDVTDGEVIGSHINILLEPNPGPMGLVFSRFGFSHELFHLWNGKSMRSNGPEDWFTEGFTNYYTLKAMHEAGILDERGYFAVMDGLFFGRYVSDEGYGVLSMRDAVPEKHAHWGLIYAGGMFTAICQDVEIRLASNNTRSLDDVMRQVYARYAGAEETFGVADIESLIGEASDYDPSTFFERHVQGIEPIPIAECLSRASLDAAIVDGHLSVSRTENPGTSNAIVEGILGRIHSADGT